MSTEGIILPTDLHKIIGGAYYSDGERYHPYLECSCGFVTHGSDSWEDAGMQLDEHVESLPMPMFAKRKQS